MAQVFEQGTVVVLDKVYEANRNTTTNEVYWYKGSRTHKATRRIRDTFKSDKEVLGIG